MRRRFVSGRKAAIFLGLALLFLVFLGGGMAMLAAGLAGPREKEVPLPEGVRADAIIIEKGSRRLLLMRGGKVLKVYRIALGRNPRGPKRREGDGRTPEGRYRIDWRNPKSAYHLSLHISYPDRADRERARKAGVPPGGMIMIHGLPNGLGWIGRLHRALDWTNGCVAVTDREIEELWRAVPDGTVVEIRP